jgi:hypothetical protein
MQPVARLCSVTAERMQRNRSWNLGRQLAVSLDLSDTVYITSSVARQSFGDSQELTVCINCHIKGLPGDLAGQRRCP